MLLEKSSSLVPISTLIPLQTGTNDHENRKPVDRLIAELEASGKICPKPWCWKRFFILFKPHYEPCWLTSWWETSNEDKKALFRMQLLFLARATDRFPAARNFLDELDETCWLHHC